MGVSISLGRKCHNGVRLSIGCGEIVCLFLEVEANWEMLHTPGYNPCPATCSLSGTNTESSTEEMLQALQNSQPGRFRSRAFHFEWNTTRLNDFLWKSPLTGCPCGQVWTFILKTWTVHGLFSPWTYSTVVWASSRPKKTYENRHWSWLTRTITDWSAQTERSDLGDGRESQDIKDDRKEW